MIDRVVSKPTTAAADPAAPIRANTRAATEGQFAAVFRTAAEKVSATDKSEAVAGHRYAKVTEGDHKELYVNQTDNARKDELFRLISRGGREYHVYGTGADKQVFELKAPTVAPDSAAKG